MISIFLPRNAEEKEAVAQWIMGNLGRRAVKPYQCLAAINSEGRLVGGALFNNYNGNQVDLSVYGPGVASRKALRAICRYAFVVLKCSRMTVRTTRKRSTIIGGSPLNGPRGILTRMGFTFEACAHEYYAPGKGGDAMVYRMLRAECPWIKLGESHGRTRGARSERNGRSPGHHESGNGYHPEGLEQLQSGDPIR